MPPRNPESFGPELLAALIEGSRRTLELELPEYRKGVFLRQRLHQLRTAMDRTKHPMASLVQKTKLSLLYGKEAGYPDVLEERRKNGIRFPTDPSVPCKLILSPRDSEFAAALAKAGVVVGADPAEGDQLVGEKEPSIDDLLNEFTES